MKSITLTGWAKILCFFLLAVASSAVDYINLKSAAVAWHDMLAPIAVFTIIKGAALTLVAYLTKSPVNSNSVLSESPPVVGATAPQSESLAAPTRLYVISSEE